MQKKNVSEYFFSNRKSHILSWMLLGVLIAGCSFPAKTSRLFLEEAIEQGGYDLIVVPGVPFADGQWSYTMKGRIYWAKYLYDAGVARNIMFSGSAVYSPYNEAEIMYLYGIALGIPAANLFTEIMAEHSTENIFYSHKKAKKLGFNSIALASDPFQSKMLYKFTRKVVSRDIGFLPMVADTLEKMKPLMSDPAISYQHLYIQDFVPITSRESFRMRFRGTRGLNIDTTAYNHFNP